MTLGCDRCRRPWMRDLIGLRARLLLLLPECDEVIEERKHGFVFTIVRLS